MKKNIIILGSLLIILLIINVFLLIGGKSKSDNSDIKVSKSVVGKAVFPATQITCTYPQILNVAYINNEISHNLPSPEKNPLIFTFSQLNDSEGGLLSYIDATQTISSIPLIKINEDDEKITYIDRVATYLTTHTIYKKLGVSTYTKNISLFGTPTGSLAMGTCVGY